MNLRAALNLFLPVSICLCLGINGMPVDVPESRQRTAIPLLLLLNYPQAYARPGILPGIPVRRPQDEVSAIEKPAQLTSSSQLADEVPQSADTNNDVIRQQFLQGILQGLQSQSSNASPAALADLLAQVNAVRTTATPKITPPSVEKEAQAIEQNDGDYDYIDFKNGSRIKYDLGNDQPSQVDGQYPNKILADPQFVGYLRSQQHAI